MVDNIMPDDTELLNWLDKQTGKYGDSYVVWRWSTTGRGWRLHETTSDASCRKTVREAIADAMLKVTLPMVY